MKMLPYDIRKHLAKRYDILDYLTVGLWVILAIYAVITLTGD